MAHLIKSTRAASGGLTRHYERFKNEKGEYLKFGNQEINIEKSHLNYNLADDKNQLEFIKQRTSEVKCLNRKDVNVMANWVITLPESIKTLEDQEKFFKESYKFLEEKYGKENVISSFVHLDESTPHMHFAFVPIVYDKNKEEYKVSAKECITRNHLKKFHGELEIHMEKAFGYEVGILNEKTKEGNRSIEELKKETAIKELNSLKENIKDKQVTLDSVKNDLKALKDDLRVINISKDEIKKINEIESSKPLFGKGKVTLSEEDYENLLNISKMAIIEKEKGNLPYLELISKYKKSNQEMKKEIDELNEKIDKKLILEKESIIKPYEDVIVKYKKEIERLNEKENIRNTPIEKKSLDGILKGAKKEADVKNSISSLQKHIKELEKFISAKKLENEFNKFNNREKTRNRYFKI